MIYGCMGVSFRIHENKARFFMFLILKAGLLFCAIPYQFGAAALKVMESNLSLKIRFACL